MKFDPNKPIKQSNASTNLPEGARTDDAIEEMFDLVLAAVNHRSDFGEMLSDMYDWWQKKGFLTERQYETLERAYERNG